jgi:O-antigen/teichoic acid export membrane protein
VQPQLYKSISTGQATTQTIRHDFFRYLKLLCFFSAACIAVVVFAYCFLINKLYFSGLPYFFIVALSSFIWALNYFLFLFLLYYKKKRTILNVALISITCSITVNIILVKNYLILGDALSGLINTLIFSGIIIVVVQKLIKDHFSNVAVKTAVSI